MADIPFDQILAGEGFAGATPPVAAPGTGIVNLVATGIGPERSPEGPARGHTGPSR